MRSTISASSSGLGEPANAAGDHQTWIFERKYCGGAFGYTRCSPQKKGPPAMRRSHRAQFIHQFHTRYAFAQAIAFALCRPHHPHAIGHVEGCAVQGTHELSVAPGSHDELWVNRSELVCAALQDQPLSHIARFGQRHIVDGHTEDGEGWGEGGCHLSLTFALYNRIHEPRAYLSG